MSSTPENNELVIYAAGDDWQETMPAGEWAAMAAKERTGAVVLAWARHEVQNRPSPPGERERLLEGIATPWLAELVWQAWQALPYYEQAVLSALRVRVVERELEEGELGAMLTWYDKHQGLQPHTLVCLEPEKYGPEAPNLTLSVILHEFCHAAYRHGEMGKLVETVCPDLAHEYETIIEKHAEEMAARWHARMNHVAKQEVNHV